MKQVGTDSKGRAIVLKSGVRVTIDRTRDEGFEHETNDCFVRAVHQATGVPYRDAHAFVRARFDRVSGRGTIAVAQHMARMAQSKCTIYGYRVFVRPVMAIGQSRRIVRRRDGSRVCYVRPHYATLASSMHKFREGRFILCSNSHGWAIVDGVVLDNGAVSGRAQVTEIYELIPSSKCEEQGI